MCVLLSLLATYIPLLMNLADFLWQAPIFPGNKTVHRKCAKTFKQGLYGDEAKHRLKPGSHGRGPAIRAVFKVV